MANWQKGLQAANEVRSGRADTLLALRTGDLLLHEAINREELQTITVFDLLRSVPIYRRKAGRVGGKRSSQVGLRNRQVLGAAHINGADRLEALTQPQKLRLVLSAYERLPYYAHESKVLSFLARFSQNGGSANEPEQGL